MAAPSFSQQKPWHHDMALLNDLADFPPTGENVQIYTPSECSDNELAHAKAGLISLGFDAAPDDCDGTASFVSRFISLHPVSGRYVYWSPHRPANPGVREKLPEDRHSVEGLIRELLYVYPMMKWTTRPI